MLAMFCSTVLNMHLLVFTVNVQIIVCYFTCKIRNHKHLFLFYLSMYFFYFTIQFILKYFINPCILSLYFSSLFPFFSIFITFYITHKKQCLYKNSHKIAREHTISKTVLGFYYIQFSYCIFLTLP